MLASASDNLETFNVQHSALSARRSTFNVQHSHNLPGLPDRKFPDLGKNNDCFILKIIISCAWSVCHTLSHSESAVTSAVKAQGRGNRQMWGLCIYTTRMSIYSVRRCEKFVDCCLLVNFADSQMPYYQHQPALAAPVIIIKCSHLPWGNLHCQLLVCHAEFKFNCESKVGRGCGSSVIGLCPAGPNPYAEVYAVL